ncbi:hypothetical protein TcBrA4_0117350 [Trypanosoma cruzi]|nr:hypothetical protein TcBrA4_0117350 [Trypanosoma cruzi]
MCSFGFKRLSIAIIRVPHFVGYRQCHLWEWVMLLFALDCRALPHHSLKAVPPLWTPLRFLTAFFHSFLPLSSVRRLLLYGFLLLLKNSVLLIFLLMLLVLIVLGDGAAGDCVNSGVGCCTGGLLAADDALEVLPVSTVFCKFSFPTVTSSFSGPPSVPCSVEDCSSAFGCVIAGACGLGSEVFGSVVPECTPVSEKLFF